MPDVMGRLGRPYTDLDAPFEPVVVEQRDFGTEQSRKSVGILSDPAHVQ